MTGTQTPTLCAISGVKNSGKTTLITKLLPLLTAQGLKVATIKHDGHDFGADVPGTDSHAHLQAGAYGTAVFSSSKFMVVKQQENVLLSQLQAYFPEADLILLEGFKDSHYPKLEVVRQGNSDGCVCGGDSLFGVVSDFTPQGCQGLPLFGLEDVTSVAQLLLDLHFAHTSLSFLVLAGGQSSRMGREKSDLDYQGQSFLETMLSKGRRLGIGDCYVSGYRGASCSAPVIPDRHPNRGPLGGMEASFRQMKHSHCLVLGVDLPGLQPATLLHLIATARHQPDQPTILCHQGKEEPLMGVYPCKLYQVMEEELLQGKGSVFHFLRKVGYHTVEVSAGEQEFWNINDMASYRGLIKQ